ncbi:hypothetical protein DFH06DRAFT_1482477 [Mycena polygramma]|nr:hypothetical protein DFH06DRAFT_1482477 [Mycena polygramma]
MRCALTMLPPFSFSFSGFPLRVAMCDVGQSWMTARNTRGGVRTGAADEVGADVLHAAALTNKRSRETSTSGRDVFGLAGRPVMIVAVVFVLAARAHF